MRMKTTLFGDSPGGPCAPVAVSFCLRLQAPCPPTLYLLPVWPRRQTTLRRASLCSVRDVVANPDACRPCNVCLVSMRWVHWKSTAKPLTCRHDRRKRLRYEKMPIISSSFTNEKFKPYYTAARFAARAHICPAVPHLRNFRFDLFIYDNYVMGKSRPSKASALPCRNLNTELTRAIELAALSCLQPTSHFVFRHR